MPPLSFKHESISNDINGAMHMLTAGYILKFLAESVPTLNIKEQTSQ